MSFLTVDMASLDRLVDQLGDDTEAAARPAAQAAAQVLYDQVERNVSALGSVTGNLRRAIYQAFSKENSGPGHATYHISWNRSKAPHGHLVEFGHIQRYVSYIGSDGKWYTAIRPSMRGKPRPGRGSSQAAKDAYYVTLPALKQTAAGAFVRGATSQFPQAAAAAEAELLKRIA